MLQQSANTHILTNMGGDDTTQLRTLLATKHCKIPCMLWMQTYTRYMCVFTTHNNMVFFRVLKKNTFLPTNFKVPSSETKHK